MQKRPRLVIQSNTPSLQYSILLETREKEASVRLPFHLETERHDGFREGSPKKEVHFLHSEPELLGQKRPEVEVEFQKLQNPFYRLLSVLGDPANMVKKDSITAFFPLFFDYAQENTAFYNIFSLELGALVESHELCSVPALEAGALRGPVFVNGAVFFLSVIENTATLTASFLPDFDHFLISGNDSPMNIVSDEFTFSNSIKMLSPQIPAFHQSLILHLQGRARLQTAFPATDTASSRRLRIHAGHFTRPWHFGKKKTPFIFTAKAKGV